MAFLKCASVAAFAAMAAAGAPAPPNMVLMLIDDIGYADIDLGLVVPPATPAIQPNFKQWAASSGAVVFERAYIGGSVCSPTRASILTGRTPSRDCVINVEQNALPMVNNVSTTAAYAKSAGYRTGFFGKWHLGTLSNATNPDCYTPTTKNVCSPGYVTIGALCCDGRDAHVALAAPNQFGFDTVMATPQVAPTSQANCGCIMTVPPGQNSTDRSCNIGHYAGAGHDSVGDWVECDQYFTGNDTDAAGSLSSVPYVTPVDDAAFLVDNFEIFASAAVSQGQPFFAQISFHHNHIPYISPPQYRAPYAAMGYDLNSQDYYGALSNLDAEVGRVRQILRNLGIENDTFVALMSDNGPEINTGGHDCATFFNPGVTGGLVGRKRALTEGGIRIPGIIEYPRLVTRNRVERSFPISTVDFLPTLMDMLNSSSAHPAGSWPLDGVSLLPILAANPAGTGTGASNGASGASGSAQAPVLLNRTQPLGWLSNFTWEQAPPEVPAVVTCASRAKNIPPPSFNASTFATPFGQHQFAWSEGPYKLFACKVDGTNAQATGTTNSGNSNAQAGATNSTRAIDGEEGIERAAASGTATGNDWRFSLYNVQTDRNETTDLWPQLGSTVGESFFQGILRWFESINNSVANESGCTIGHQY